MLNEWFFLGQCLQDLVLKRVFVSFLALLVANSKVVPLFLRRKWRFFLWPLVSMKHKALVNNSFVPLLLT
jgi:hypothetical protein